MQRTPKYAYNSPTNRVRRVRLKRWHLRNFKSVREADVQLSPLTLLVGANSAGKSTLLQSILAVSQAAMGSGNRFPLNGGMVRLGSVGETLYQGPAAAGDDRLEVGAVFAMQRLFRGATSTGSRAWPPTPGDGAPDTEVEWTLTLGRGSKGGNPADTAEGGRAQIESLTMDVASGEAVGPRGGGASMIVQTQGGSKNQRFHGQAWSSQSGEDKVTDVELRGGFPTDVRVERQKAEVMWQLWTEAFFSSLQEAPGSKPDSTNVEAAVERVVREIVGVYRSHAGDVETESDDDQGFDIDMMLRAVFREGVDPTVLDVGLYQEVGFVDRVLEGLQEAGLTGTWSVSGGVRQITTPAAAISDYLRRQVRYLGPLREDPRVVYQDSPAAGTGHVGNKGEFCAAVLQTSGSQRVRVPLPRLQLGETRLVTLSSAVDMWADYLELGQRFSAQDRGRLGLQMQIDQAHVAIPLDLTSVGTGVSQLLPVLVMCLQSEPGSLLLMEQPELHLNPKVQQRLADFLLAIASSGRQLIVETHSEYLISRLRLRVAEDADDIVKDRVGILFAERSEGTTTYRRVEPNTYGGLDNWPEGFFDHSVKESQNILRAALAKRMAKAPNEEPLPPG